LRRIVVGKKREKVWKLEYRWIESDEVLIRCRCGKSFNRKTYQLNYHKRVAYRHSLDDPPVIDRYYTWECPDCATMLRIEPIAPTIGCGEG